MILPCSLVAASLPQSPHLRTVFRGTPELRSRRRPELKWKADDYVHVREQTDSNMRTPYLYALI
jgi:hypothetical protein